MIEIVIIILPGICIVQVALVTFYLYCLCNVPVAAVTAIWTCLLITDDMKHMEEEESDYEEFEEDMEWLEEEKEEFKLSRDADGDGLLNFEEIRDWIMPEDKEAEHEATHLLDSADANKVCPCVPEILHLSSYLDLSTDVFSLQLLH